MRILGLRVSVLSTGADISHNEHYILFAIFKRKAVCMCLSSIVSKVHYVVSMRACKINLDHQVCDSLKVEMNRAGSVSRAQILYQPRHGCPFDYESIMVFIVMTNDQIQVGQD